MAKWSMGRYRSCSTSAAGRIFYLLAGRKNASPPDHIRAGVIYPIYRRFAGRSNVATMRPQVAGISRIRASMNAFMSRVTSTDALDSPPRG